MEAKIISRRVFQINKRDKLIPLLKKLRKSAKNRRVLLHDLHILASTILFPACLTWKMVFSLLQTELVLEK